jgi:signal transduction histidine kinase
MAHAFLDPIDQLTEATRRVHAGDLDSRVPLTSGDEFGVLAVSFNQMLDGLQEREHLRSHNVELTGRLEESLEEVRESRARIVAAADAERRRMERDLHDGAQQRLVMISLKLGMASNLIESDPAAALALHEELSQDASRAIEELRDLAHGIYPPLLESDGLTSALEDIADQSPVPVAMECEGTDRYPAAVEAAVYFCCLEALQNTVKHAGADSRATIHLSEEEGDLHFAVSDDGRGFDVNGQPGSTGMQNMTDRMGALGGTICVTSRPGAGTKIEGWVPVRTASSPPRLKPASRHQSQWP